MPEFNIDAIVNPDRAVKGAKRVRDELAKIGPAAKKSFDQAEREAKEFRASLKDVGAGFTEAGAGATALGIAAAAAIGGTAALAISQESAFAGVKKTIDDTTEGYAALSAELRILSETIPASFEETARIAEIGGQLGIARENIVDFTDVIIRLGESTNLVGEEGATALARFINVTDATQAQVSNLGSAIVALGNTSATTEAEIATMATRIGLSGTQAGLSAADILGFSAALSSAGISAELGGTNFSKFAAQLNTAVIQGGSALQGFADIAGQSSADFQKAFRDDAASAITTFLVGLDEIGKSGGDVASTLDNLGIKSVEMQRTVLALAVNNGKLTDSLNLSATAFRENTALTIESNKRFETTASQLEILKNKFANLGADIGGLFIPTIIDLGKEASVIIDDLRALGEQFDGLGEKAGAAAIGFTGIVGVLGPAAIAIGAVAVAFGGIGLAIGGAIVALGLIGGAAFAFREEIGNVVVGMGDWIDELTASIPFMDQYTAALETVTDAIKDVAVSLIDQLVANHKIGLDAAREFFGELEGRGAKALKDAAGLQEGYADTILATAKAAGEADDEVGDYFETVNTAAEMATDAAKETEGLNKQLEENAQLAGEAAKKGKELADAWRKTAEAAREQEKANQEVKARQQEVNDLLDIAAPKIDSVNTAFAALDTVMRALAGTSHLTEAGFDAMITKAKDLQQEAGFARDAVIDLDAEFANIPLSALPGAASIGGVNLALGEVNETAERTPRILQGVSTAITDLGRDIVDGFFDSGRFNSELDQQEQDLLDSLSNREADFEEFTREVEASMEDLTASHAEEVAEMERDFEESVAARSAAFREFVADSKAQFEELQDDLLRKQEKSVKRLNDRIADSRRKLLDIEESSGRKIVDNRRDTEQKIGDASAARQDDMLERERDLNQFIADANEDLAGKISDIRRRGGKDAAAQIRREEQQTSQSIARRKREFQDWIDDTARDLERRGAILRRENAEEEADIKASLARRRKEQARHADEIKLKIQEIRDETKRRLEAEEEEINKSLAKRKADFETWKDDAIETLEEKKQAATDKLG
ncbi:MAG: phage tail tape measure protein, partial [Planctomycetes bacterium]|nr:phage tail tape measure protein [Planctomycetota bacterium]